MRKITTSLTDVVSIGTGSKREITEEGFLRAPVVFTSVGIQEYYGQELGIEPYDKAFKIFRSPDTVFHPDTITSLKLKPVTADHPDEDVTVENYKKLAVGHVGDSIEPLDDLRLGGNILIHDPEIITEVTNGTREQVSCGYLSDILMIEGEWNGQKYDGRFDGPMYNNHLACVASGRCGGDVRILDNSGETPMKKSALLKAMKDKGIDPTRFKAFNDAGDDTDVSEDLVAEMLGTTVPDVTAIADKLKDAMMGMKGEAKDMDMGAMLGMLIKALMSGMMGEDGVMKKDAKPQQPQPGGEMKKFDDAVALRVNLITDAAPLLPDDFKVEGKSDRDIMTAALGDSVDTKDKSDDYVRARFDAMVADRAKAGEHMEQGYNDAAPGSVVDAPKNAVDLRRIQRAQRRK